MPRHSRTGSESQRHATDMRSTYMQAQAFDAHHQQQQQRISIAPSYYTIPPEAAAAAAATAMPLQQEVVSSYEPYNDDNDDGDESSLSHHRPSSGAWTAADDVQLIKARKHGLNWKQIRNTYFPNKSPNACRKRHERLLERREPDEWSQDRLQNLARNYMELRKDIWAPLAARTGERWNVVEQRCMSNGLKNLQSAARAASRLERYRNSSAGDHASNGYDDDSGVSGIGLTPVDEIDGATIAGYSSPEISPSANQSFNTVTGGASLIPSHHHVLQQQHLAAMQSAHALQMAQAGHHHSRNSSYDLSVMYAAYAEQQQQQQAYSSSSSSNASMVHPYVSRGGRGSSQGSSPYS